MSALHFSPRAANTIRTGPEVARVAITTLRRLREALDGDASPAEIAELRRDLDRLIDAARWAGEPL